ncbi:MAG: hypothetical protein PHE49_10015 [bacterium]|nr:hypothetical protein [bacterium]
MGHPPSETLARFKAQQIESENRIIKHPLIAKYNFIENSEELLAEVPTEGLSTIQKENLLNRRLENALIRKDNRPIMFLGSLDSINDMVKGENKYYVYFRFSSSSPSMYNFDMRPILESTFFIIECDSQQVKKIKMRKSLIKDYSQPSLSVECAIIAMISSIQKLPKFKGIAYPIKEDNKKGEPTMVESPDMFIVKGRCLELLFVDYSISKTGKLYY